jgi:hypothetical protein
VDRVDLLYNPMVPFPGRRSGLFQPRLAQCVLLGMPDEQLSVLLARLSSHRAGRWSRSGSKISGT